MIKKHISMILLLIGMFFMSGCSFASMKESYATTPTHVSSKGEGKVVKTIYYNGEKYIVKRDAKGNFYAVPINQVEIKGKLNLE